MAMYKVPQDVEADDKFLGPLSFKQFLFMGGALVFAYASFVLVAQGLWPVALITLLPTIVFGFLAFPWSGEQPTELWLASRIRFFLKPRRRIWDQSGIKDLVNITAPKKANVHALTDGLNQGQVRSRMSALATMVDSRGWAAKNYAVTPAQQAAILEEEESDRLVEGTLPEASKLDSITANTKDVMDENNSAIAQQFDTMIQRSAEQHKQVVQQNVTSAQVTAGTAANTQQEDFWFMHQNGQQAADPNLGHFAANPVVAPGMSPQQSTSAVPAAQTATTQNLDEAGLLDKVHDKQKRDKLQTASSHEKTVAPLSKKRGSQKAQKKTTQKQDKTTVTHPKDPVILNLANSNDLNVATLSRQANRDLPNDEVVISLR